jgi:hypothetical protein
MSAVASRLITGLLVWTAAAVALGWARLPASGRRALALLTSAAGLAALMLGFSRHGEDWAPMTSQFLLSAGDVIGHVSASSGLKYYVVTAACLLLGTIGLAVPDQAAERMDKHWLATAIVLSMGVTALRFALEKVAAPPSWTFAVGITWLAPIVGAYCLGHLRDSGQGFKALLRALFLYALGARGTVAALMVVATLLNLGSHYDVSDLTSMRILGRMETFAPGSARQILWLAVLPQLSFWVFYTMVAGLFGAMVLALVQRVGKTRSRQRPAAAPEPAEQRVASL